MKKGLKFYIYSIIIFCAFFITQNVGAYTAVEPTCVDKNECLLLCNYNEVIESSNKKINRNISIYYYFDGDWEIKWESFNADRSVNKIKKHNFTKVFSKNSLSMENNYTMDDFQCPAKAYIDNNTWVGNNEICFDNGGDYCKNASNAGTSFNKESGNEKPISSGLDYNFEDDIDIYLNNSSFKDISLDSILDGTYKSANDVAEKFDEDFRTNYMKGYSTPVFILNLDSYQNAKNNLKNSFEIEKNRISDEALLAKEEGRITEEQYENVLDTLEKIDNNLESAIEKKLQEIAQKRVVYGTVDCDTLLGDPKDNQSPAYWLQFCLNIMKYAGIVALMGLSTMDFFKALTQDDKDAIKKATTTTIKRFIFVVLLFFLPIIVEMIMNVLGAYGTCGIR